MKKVFSKEANEPNATYGNSTLQLSKLFKGIVISTLKEQENGMREYSASLSPVERMAYLQDLIKIAYGHLLNDTDVILWDKKIIIDQRP